LNYTRTAVCRSTTHTYSILQGFTFVKGFGKIFLGNFNNLKASNHRISKNLTFPPKHDII